MEEHFVEMVQRIQNLEVLMEEARTQIRGTPARVTVVEQNVSNGTANISNETKRRLNITTYKGFSDVPVFSGTHDEYEDWSFKLRTFLSTEEKWFGILLKTVESLDREVKDYDIDDFVQNSPPEVTTELADWMNTQLYNVLTLKTKDNPSRRSRMWPTKKMSAASLLGSSCCGLTKGRTLTEASNLQNVSTTSSGSFRMETCSLGWRNGRLF